MLRPEYIARMLRVFVVFKRLVSNYIDQFITAELHDIVDYLDQVYDILRSIEESRIRHLNDALNAVVNIRSNVLSARDLFKYFIDQHRFMCDELKATLEELERGEITERALKLKIEEIDDVAIARVRSMIRVCEQSFSAYNSLFIEFNSIVDAIVALCNSYEEFLREIGKTLYLHPSEVKGYVGVK